VCNGCNCFLNNKKNIEYSVDSIEQYPLNILWIVSSKVFEYSVENIEQYPSAILWTVLRNVSCVLTVLRIIHLLRTILRYIHCIIWKILRIVRNRLVENENFMSSKAFPLSNSVPQRINADCRWLLLAVSVCLCDCRATVLSSWLSAGPCNHNSLL
jgi:hypothetical protein